MVVTKLPPDEPAPSTMMPRSTSVEANVPDNEVRAVDPSDMAPSVWDVPPRPAPITWTYLPASAEANDPDADVRMAEPAVMAPSVRMIASAVAPKAVTLTLV